MIYYDLNALLHGRFVTLPGQDSPCPLVFVVRDGSFLLDHALLGPGCVFGELELLQLRGQVTCFHTGSHGLRPSPRPPKVAPYRTDYSYDYYYFVIILTLLLFVVVSFLFL